MKKILLLNVCLSIFVTHNATSAFAQEYLDEVPAEIENFTVAPSLLQTIADVLPEETGQIDQNFLNQDYDPNIRLNLDSQLAITFIDEGAGYRNALGYFSYTDSSFLGKSFSDIDTNSSGRISSSEIQNVSGVSASMIFPNASKVGAGGLLNMGDTYVLGGGDLAFTTDSWEITNGTVFDANTNIGFFLAANAWNDYGSVGTVDGWDGVAGDPFTYYSLDFLNPENDASATIDTIDYNARHVALTFESEDRNTLIMGFEDLHRLYGSDDDFNDAVFLVRSDPTGAMSETDVEVYSAPAPLAGGGLIGLLGFMVMGFARRFGLHFAI